MFLCRIRTLPDDDRIPRNNMRDTVEIPSGRPFEAMSFVIKSAVVAGAVEHTVVGVVVEGAAHVGAVGIQHGDRVSGFADVEFGREDRGDPLLDLRKGDAEFAPFGLAEEEQTPRRPTQGCRHHPGGDGKRAGQKIAARLPGGHNRSAPLEFDGRPFDGHRCG